MRERFENIYTSDEWGNGSGPGSSIVHMLGYIEFIESFVAQHRIKSVVDLGCGDWQFTRYVNWGCAQYLGLDIVEAVINENNARYSTDKIRFRLYSGKPSDLPGGDLLIAKDVLQHLSNSNVHRYLSCLNRYRYSLLTNCVNPSGATPQVDINDGDFRPLDVRNPPFLVSCKQVYTITNKRTLMQRLFRKNLKWIKPVLMIESAAVSQ